MKIFLSIMSIFLISGCASGLYIKTNSEASIAEFKKVNCDWNLSDAESSTFKGKILPANGSDYTEEDFNNNQFPTEAEKQILKTLYLGQFECRPKYIQWVRDFAPLSYNVVNAWNLSHVDIFRQLSQGNIAYGPAVLALINNLSQMIVNLEELEFIVEEQRKNKNNALLEAYLGRLGNSSNRNNQTQNTNILNNNLTQRCSSQGKTPNFGTGGCF